MSNGSKQCSRCGETKSLSEFYRRALSADGRSASCSACQKRYREENREKVLESSRRYREQNPDKVRESRRRYQERKRGGPPRKRQSGTAQDRRRKYSEQNPDRVRESRRRWRLKNRDKLRADAKRYRERNLDKVRETQRRWQESNPDAKRMYTQRRKARKRNAVTFTVSAKDLRRLRTDRCVACGEIAGTVDHLIPLSRGGSHGVGNLVAMCGSCNSRKSAKTISEWRKANGWLPLGRFSELRKEA